ncbi:MAG: hypothetical protein M3281_03375 [Chloroflexota bacterium]|nr:hypothetical protein [Chloroflexota bacterium]
MKQAQRATEPSPVGLSPRDRDTIAHLVAQRNSLVDRLNNGSRQIEELRAAGEDVTSWEEFWVKLLQQYERVCDKLAQLERSVELRRAS